MFEVLKLIKHSLYNKPTILNLVLRFVARWKSSQELPTFEKALRFAWEQVVSAFPTAVFSDKHPSYAARSPFSISQELFDGALGYQWLLQEETANVLKKKDNTPRCKPVDWNQRAFEWYDPSTPHVGLCNLGARCFAKTRLQCTLCSTTSPRFFTDIIAQQDHVLGMHSALVHVVIDMARAPPTPIICSSCQRNRSPCLKCVCKRAWCSMPCCLGAIELHRQDCAVHLLQCEGMATRKLCADPIIRHLLYSFLFGT